MKPSPGLRFAQAVLLGLVLTVPGTLRAAEPVASNAPAATGNGPIAAAIANPDRLPGDAEQDERRRADEILAFLGVGPDMRVIDVFAAGGYYTELLARIVGPGGKVIAYNNEPYFRFAGKKIGERYAGNRLPNVVQLTAGIDALGLEPASLDAAIFVMSYHDLYWRPKDGSWPETDPQRLLAGLHAALKPGGIVVVQDHVAKSGSDPVMSVDALHRIDPAIVRRDFERAGFVFDGESRALAHPGDELGTLVFDPAIQGRTDQFVYRFRKPAAAP